MSEEEMLRRLDEAKVRRHLIRLGRACRSRRATAADLSGGGVLLQNKQGRKGILTAGHCVKQLQHRGERNAVALCTVAPGRPDVAAVPIKLDGAEIALYGNDGATPDIGWIPLDPSTAAAIEQYYCVFVQPWRKTAPQERPKEPGGKGREAWLTTVVHGWMEAHEREIGGETMIANLEMLKRENREETAKETDREGWDYSDHTFHDASNPSTREPSAEMPTHLQRDIDLGKASRGGYSGCPVWNLWWITGKEEWEYRLLGIAFYELPAKPDGERKLRIHREESIECITTQRNSR